MLPMEAEGPHRVPVVVAASPSYVQPLAVTLTSLLENAGPSTNYDIYVLVADEYPGHVNAKVMDLVNRYRGTTITFMVVDHDFDHVKVATSHVRVQTYYRLLIPSRLAHLDRVIYLDVDVVVEQDLTPLFRTALDDRYLAGVTAPAYRRHSDARAARIGLPSYDRYVNAGVLLMNLANIRRDGLEERFIELAAQDLKADDQDALNIACYDAIKLLPPHFNLMTKYRPANIDEFLAYPGVSESWTREECEEALSAPTVIHYADKRKPWLNTSIDFADRWWHYALLSPFAADIVTERLDSALLAGQKQVLHYRAALSANTGLERELRITRKSLEAVRASRSYKFGRLVTAVPRRAKALITRAQGLAAKK